MAEDYIAWQTQPLQWFGLLVMACAAAALTLELARRAGRHRGAPRWMWLACGGLALGSGLWSGHFIALSGPQLPIGIGYGGWLSLAGWAAAVSASLGSLAIATGGKVKPRRAATSATVLGIGAFASEWLCFLDMNMGPPIVWHPGWAAAAIAVVAVTGAACYPLASSVASGKRRGLLRASAPLLLGGGMALGHKASALAAQIDLEAISLNHLSGLTGNSLTVLACFGTSLVLLVMLMLVGVERRMQRALRQAVSTIEANASTDALTGLPNFRAFERCIEGHDGPAGRKAPLALLYIALDGLKPVNESFGRPVGDRLLQDITRRLKALTRSDATLARVGGDEFALMLPGESKTDVVLKLAHEVLASVSATGSIDVHTISLSCSIGMVMYPQHGSRSKMLVRGEAAAQAVKKDGGAAASFFDPRLLAGTREQLELLQELRSAIGTGQLELYYQPKIHAESGAITGAEALMRWHHPKRGMVSPGIFIPIAERHGLINALGDWLIDEACRQARVWRDEGLRMRVAINMSVSQLRQAGMADRIAQSLAKYQINPQQLTCEITESLAMEDSSATVRFFEDIARIGVHISIDDFGTGYSSLAYLRKLPAEELKIDRSFVLDLETSADARAVVDAVVKLAQALGLKVVAEGVETEAQNRILRGLGCDELQGFLFAKPMSAKALGLWAMTSDGPAPLKFRDSLFLETQTADVA